MRYDDDAFGRRTWKRDDFGTTEFIWNGNRLLQEIRGRRCLSYVYEDNSFVPFAQIEASSAEAPQPATGTNSVVRFFHTDQSGAPREPSSADGSVAWRAGYRVWRNTLVVEQAEPTPRSVN